MMQFEINLVKDCIYAVVMEVLACREKMDLIKPCDGLVFITKTFAGLLLNYV